MVLDIQTSNDKEWKCVAYIIFYRLDVCILTIVIVLLLQMTESLSRGISSKGILINYLLLNYSYKWTYNDFILQMIAKGEEFTSQLKKSLDDELPTKNLSKYHEQTKDCGVDSHHTSWKQEVITRT